MASKAEQRTDVGVLSPHTTTRATPRRRSVTSRLVAKNAEVRVRRRYTSPAREAERKNKRDDEPRTALMRNEGCP